MDKDFSVLEKTIGVTFKDQGLLKRALTHRSYINEHRGEDLHHNERLEFLGDAVLELATTEFLFAKFPDHAEGELTAFRASLVNTDALMATSEEIGVNDFILLSKGEAKDTGRARAYILANTIEAIIGAIYIDQGYEPAKGFVDRFMTHKIDKIIEDKAWVDAKSLFQEKSQDNEGVTPTYKTVEEEGPDHDKHFTVAVYLKDDEIGKGEGQSKQDAEQAAARNALGVKGWL